MKKGIIASVIAISFILIIYFAFFSSGIKFASDMVKAKLDSYDYIYYDNYTVDRNKIIITNFIIDKEDINGFYLEASSVEISKVSRELTGDIYFKDLLVDYYGGSYSFDNALAKADFNKIISSDFDNIVISEFGISSFTADLKNSYDNIIGIMDVNIGDEYSEMKLSDINDSNGFYLGEFSIGTRDIDSFFNTVVCLNNYDGYSFYGEECVNEYMSEYEESYDENYYINDDINDLNYYDELTQISKGLQLTHITFKDVNLDNELIAGKFGITNIDMSLMSGDLEFYDIEYNDSFQDMKVNIDEFVITGLHFLDIYDYYMNIVYFNDMYDLYNKENYVDSLIKSYFYPPITFSGIRLDNIKVTYDDFSILFKDIKSNVKFTKDNIIGSSDSFFTVVVEADSNKIKDEKIKKFFQDNAGKVNGYVSYIRNVDEIEGSVMESYDIDAEGLFDFTFIFKIADINFAEINLDGLLDSTFDYLMISYQDRGLKNILSERDKADFKDLFENMDTFVFNASEIIDMMQEFYNNPDSLSIKSKPLEAIKLRAFADNYQDAVNKADFNIIINGREVNLELKDNKNSMDY